MNKPAEQHSILSVEHVVNRFGEQTVHDGVNLEVKRGEILGIVGSSGSGKSVLLKTMVGLHKPTAGKIILAGKSLDSLTPFELASERAMLFQEGALFSSLTVAENIMFPLKEYTNLPEQARQQLVQLKLALVGMEAEAASKYPAELSGGMKKRVALARALAMDPMILFLDEPTAGLDPLLASGFDEMIVKLNKSLGITVVMVTHDLNSLFLICDRVAVLVDKKMLVDTLPNLLKNQHPWIKEYFHGIRARGARMATEESYGNE